MSGSDPSQIPQLGDPFSAAASQQTAPGFLGQSPAFWQHLAMFGGNLAAAANARTPSGHLANGTGFAGPFGAAIGETAQQAQGQALAQANVGKIGAETRGRNIENQALAYQLPFQQAQMQMQMRAFQDPNVMARLGYGDSGSGAAPYTAPVFQGGGQQPAFEAGVHQNESGGSMASGITGDGGQAHGPMQVHPEALADVNAAFKTNLTPQQITQYPELGKWAGDRYLELQQRKFGSIGGVAAYNAGPGRLQGALNGQAPLPTSTVSYVQRATGQQPTVGGPGDSLMQQAEVLEARATRLSQAQAISQLLHIPVGPGMADDPVALRAKAQQLRATALELNSAGPIAAAKFPYEQERVSPGGVLAVGGKPAFSVPQRSEEIITSGPNAGTRGQVYRDPITGQQTSSAGGGQDGYPAGFVPTELPPGQEGYLKNVPEITKGFVTKDQHEVDESLAHVIDNITPAKQALFQLRALNPDANTGAQGEFRTNFKNWVQEFAPDFVSQITGDASPAQEFKKIALMGAGKQERGDLGARGGFRAIEMYANANPNLENTPTANRDMANALLISHQYHEDYAQGATDFFNKQVAQAQKAKSYENYQRLGTFDPEFNAKMRPELYASAISAMNGKPWSEWGKGLTPKQVQIVGGILQRTDPTAVVDMSGHQVPVNSFKTVIGPKDLMNGGPNGGS